MEKGHMNFWDEGRDTTRPAQGGTRGRRCAQGRTGGTGGHGRSVMGKGHMNVGTKAGARQDLHREEQGDTGVHRGPQGEMAGV